MWMKFEAVKGTEGGFGLLPAGDTWLAPDTDGAGDGCCPDARRVFGSVFGVGSGGGNGDIETAETDA